MAFSFRFFFDASIRNFNLSLRFYGTARHLVYLAVESSRERFFSFTVRPVHVFLLHPVFYDCEMRQLHTRPSRIKLRESIPTRALALWQPPAVRFSFFFFFLCVRHLLSTSLLLQRGKRVLSIWPRRVLPFLRRGMHGAVTAAGLLPLSGGRRAV